MIKKRKKGRVINKMDNCIPNLCDAFPKSSEPSRWIRPITIDLTLITIQISAVVGLVQSNAAVLQSQAHAGISFSVIAV